MGTIGVGGFVLNNNATYANGAWAFYGEARRYAGSATTIGIENDIINEGSTVSVNPYSVLTTPGITIDYWASSGRSDVSSSATASLAYGIVNNGANFQRGIVVMSSAISGATGTSGVGEAISMAQGHQIAWYAPDGNPAAFIWSSIVSSEEGQALVFTDTGPQFRNSAGNPLFSIGASATAVDGLTLTPANTGGIPIIAASGTDTNIPLAIRAKGAAQPIYFQSNSTTVFEVAPIASGVNYLLAIGATTGNPPQLAVNGSDTNIGIALKPQGTGVVSVGGGGLQLPGFTVSTLPSCVAGLAGTIAYVTDATAPSYNAPLAGAGSVKTLALCNGSTWTAH
jgi:hypothetical protein